MSAPRRGSGSSRQQGRSPVGLAFDKDNGLRMDDAGSPSTDEEATFEEIIPSPAGDPSRASPILSSTPISPLSPYPRVFMEGNTHSISPRSSSSPTPPLFPPPSADPARFRDYRYNLASSRQSSWESLRSQQEQRHGSYSGRLWLDTFVGPRMDSSSNSPARSRSTEALTAELATPTTILSLSDKLWVSEKYNIQPDLSLYDGPEADDYLHDPRIKDKDLRRCSCVMFKRRAVVNLGGLIFIVAGVLALFVGYPVLTFVQKAIARGRASKPANA